MDITSSFRKSKSTLMASGGRPFGRNRATDAIRITRQTCRVLEFLAFLFLAGLAIKTFSARENAEKAQLYSANFAL
jgi:hypothetical protein